jgi:hypothetical protein
VSEDPSFKPGRLSHVHSVRDLLREVRERPGLWLGSRTLTGLKWLLFGYEIACALLDIDEEERIPDDIPWQAFSEWLAARCNKAGWSVDWHWLLVEHSRSQEEAFDLFFELLTEYEGRA